MRGRNCQSRLRLRVTEDLTGNKVLGVGGWGERVGLVGCLDTLQLFEVMKKLVSDLGGHLGEFENFFDRIYMK